MKLFHAVMAGGVGSRLWPLSRKAYPKQFFNLASDQSMIAETLTRLSGIDIAGNLLLCSQDHKFLAADAITDSGVEADIILEPMGKNTAPAALLAALHIIAHHDDGIILLSPSDHAIANIEDLLDSINQSFSYAESGHIITFGITPTVAETGYGYIQMGAHINAQNQNKLRAIAQFVEKPDLETANKYLEHGDYLWNSGIFMFKASTLVAEMEKCQPAILKACQAAYTADETHPDFYTIDEAAFAKCPDDSLDYAIMEHTDKGLVAKLDVNWNDLGSWNAIWDYREKDKDGNVIDADTITIKTTNSIIRSENKKLIATIGLDNVAIIETDDALLVANLDCSQEVKDLVSTLKQEKRPEYIYHREVHRPWGQFDSVDSSNRYQVKRITVKPGQKLSVQMHYHRAEHWVVVGGTALVKKGFDKDKLTEHLLRENESIYIEIGEIHSLENPGKVPLEIIEVQSGAYLGEDDIVRFSDIYGRDDH